MSERGNVPDQAPLPNVATVCDLCAFVICLFATGVSVSCD